MDKKEIQDKIKQRIFDLTDVHYLSEGEIQGNKREVDGLLFSLKLIEQTQPELISISIIHDKYSAVSEKDKQRLKRIIEKNTIANLSQDDIDSLIKNKDNENAK